MNIWFLMAGLASAGVCALHVVLGGRLFVRPLLAEERLPRVVRATHFYCWHLVTLMITMMAAGFIFAAYLPDNIALSVVLTALAVGSAALSFIIARIQRIKLARMPQWALFGLVAVLGAAGMAL